MKTNEKLLPNHLKTIHSIRIGLSEKIIVPVHIFLCQDSPNPVLLAGSPSFFVLASSVSQFLFMFRLSEEKDRNRRIWETSFSSSSGLISWWACFQTIGNQQVSEVILPGISSNSPAKVDPMAVRYSCYPESHLKVHLRKWSLHSRTIHSVVSDVDLQGVYATVYITVIFGSMYRLT